MKRIPIFLLITLPLFVVGQERLKKANPLAFVKHMYTCGIKRVDHVTQHFVRPGYHLIFATKVNSTVKSRKRNSSRGHKYYKQSKLEMEMHIALAKP